MTEPTLQDLETIARQAGEILRLGFGRGNHVQHKGEIDLVTEVDHQSEEFILRELKTRFPDHYIMAEESGASAGDQEHTWYVDPLDGTVNYAHQIPVFSVTLAYARRGEILLGVVYAPLLEEMFTAQAGQGSWLNGERLRVDPENDLNECLLVTGFPYDIRTNPTNLEYYRRFALRTQGVRRMGSAALDMSYVGAGRFNGYWESGVSSWDIAAGVLIAREAGAHVTAWDGSELNFEPPISVLAANQELHAAMLAVLRE